uniref:Uncharacterized protein n=1 Tax=Romanomermis culicivorax TaxID=13658 RepID=A0A915IRF5_ROMCU
MNSFSELQFKLHFKIDLLLLFSEKLGDRPTSSPAMSLNSAFDTTGRIRRLAKITQRETTTVAIFTERKSSNSGNKRNSNNKLHRAILDINHYTEERERGLISKTGLSSEQFDSNPLYVRTGNVFFPGAPVQKKYVPRPDKRESRISCDNLTGKNNCNCMNFQTKNNIHMIIVNAEQDGTNLAKGCPAKPIKPGKARIEQIMACCSAQKTVQNVFL